MENHQNISTCFGLVEPVADLGNEEDVEENTVIVARTPVNLNTEGIPIRLINLSSEPTEIQRDIRDIRGNCTYQRSSRAQSGGGPKESKAIYIQLRNILHQERSRTLWRKPSLQV